MPEVRYHDGGGLDADERARGERVRLRRWSGSRRGPVTERWRPGSG